MLGPYDCHVWSRGPYGGVGEFLRQIVADLLPAHRTLVERHQVELLSAVRDLLPVLPWATDTAAAISTADVQIRFHPARRTRSLAFGLTEFVAAAGPGTVLFTNVEHADGTTRELLDALAARLDIRFADALPAPEHSPEWHDERADSLAATGEWSWRLGAVPHHRLHGTAASTRGADALRTGLDHCLTSGFYEHGARLAELGLRLDSAHRWAFTTGLATCLTALDRPRAALDLYIQARETHDDPAIRMSAAASIGMLHLRHLDGDPATARPWIDEALALAALEKDPHRRAIRTVFYSQSRALLDHRTGDPAAALRTIDAGIALLDQHLRPDERPEDRARLLHNRAQVHLAVGRAPAALADLNTVITQDPYNAEYYIDRAALHRATGELDAALADYTTAIRLGPHLPEAYHNRAQVLAALGDPAAALSDLDSVLAQEPTHLDALTNRTTLHYEAGDLEAAETDARAGLAAHPDDPHLLCALALTRAEQDFPREADALLTRALDADPTLHEALVNRATIRFDLGDPDAAIADLTRAIDLADTVIARYNRAHAYESVDRRPEAAADLRAALALDDGSDPELTTELKAALSQLDG